MRRYQASTLLGSWHTTAKLLLTGQQLAGLQEIINLNASMVTDMRFGISANNPDGEFGSPRMSILMSGDIAKLEAMANNSRGAVVGGISTSWSLEESREMGNSPTGNYLSTEVVVDDMNAVAVVYQASPSVPQLSTLNEGSPQSRRTDRIFRENASTTWSNVVSSISRSLSGETLLASNTADTQPPTNLYGVNARSRSHSFESPILSMSHSLGNPAMTNQTNCSGILHPSHPDHYSYENSGFHLPMMYPSTPYHEYKPRGDSMGSWEDSMTEQTSPMSSPSLSPHVSPAIHSRRHFGDGPPPMWQLSDTNDYHSEPATPRHRVYPYLQQSIPEENYDPDGTDHHRGNYMNARPGSVRSGPMSPPRQMHSPSFGSHRQHPSMYPRRAGTNPSAQILLHHRSSTEILKTLLRKKACLYEPDTSFAVSLVTWLVGHRIALAQGFFTRQQLQAGVHSCMAGKIEEGHVTRTKVNRCMQVILNSCFHYIIPLPDGSDECGGAFRSVFSREAAEEEHLLGNLPPPWNDLNLQSMNDDSFRSFHDSDDDGDHHHQFGGKHQGKDSSAASQADESLDSQKRSVLLCFNENVRCAADVFRCHNEFIRDIAHTGNLNLSPEDWQSFFSGTKANRKRGVLSDNFHSRYFHVADVHDRMDQQGLSKLRTSWCAKRYEHDHSFCAFAHVDINRGWLRRDPFVYKYVPQMCPWIKPLQGAEDCYVNMCPHGVKCNFSHSKEEILYHPEIYKSHPCRHAAGSCSLGDICPNTHSEASAQAHGYNRQGKRHYQDHAPFHRIANPGAKRRALATTGNSAGFCNFPNASPMLYIEPAPLSEFEKTLLLPGLQALFRDHSSFVFYSTLDKSSPHEYGLFGYRNSQQKDF